MSKNRDYKEFAAGEYYHVFNRGNDKIDIFRDAEDYLLLLQRLREALYPPVQGHLLQVQKTGERYQRKVFPQKSFSLIAYCLMPNHFHFLIRQNSDISISKLMMNMVTGYSKYFNKKYTRVGSLFQDQFKAIHVVDNTQLLHLSAYIHNNPRVAGMRIETVTETYSSYAEYLETITNTERLCESAIILEQFSGAKAYRQFVDDSFFISQRNKGIKSVLFEE